MHTTRDTQPVWKKIACPGMQHKERRSVVFMLQQARWRQKPSKQDRRLRPGRAPGGILQKYKLLHRECVVTTPLRSHRTCFPADGWLACFACLLPAHSYHVVAPTSSRKRCRVSSVCPKRCLLRLVHPLASAGIGPSMSPIAPMMLESSSSCGRSSPVRYAAKTNSAARQTHTGDDNT